MGEVMITVPGIQPDGQSNGIVPLVFRVVIAAFELMRLQLAQKLSPAGVEGFQEIQGDGHGQAIVRQFCPLSLRVGHDRRLLQREGELDADKRMQVAVSTMVHDLAAIPAIGPVRLVQPVIVHWANSGPNFGWKGCDGVDPRLDQCRIDLTGLPKGANGKLKTLKC